MHYSAKTLRVNGKVKNHNSQIQPHYNARIHLLSAPNVSNSGQLQINRKYVNNMGNLNEVSLLQYHRATNMQIKSNNLEMNHYQNIRHQQHQGFVYKTPQYHNHINQNLPVNHPMQRKSNNKEHTLSAGVLHHPHKNFVFSTKKSKDLQNQQEANKVNNKNSVMPIKFRKLPTKTTNSPDDPKLLNETEGAGANISHKEVPEKVAVANGEGTKEKSKMSEIQQDMEQMLNINNESSEEDQLEKSCDKSIKTAREKTPMCLINDLARFNKISFQYRLTSENGPAHCKRFTVTLILGDEEYSAEGLKIKEAQHIAAKEAIEKTKYKHPTPKTNRRTDENSAGKSNITPTVELNALAMKLGQQTYYIFDTQQIESNSSYRLMNQSFEANKAMPQQQQIATVEDLLKNGQKVQTLNQRRQYLSKYHGRYIPLQHTHHNGSAPAPYTYFPSSSPCKITLIVGTKQFVGVGRTLQQAKHDAASNALKVLKEQMANEQFDTKNESSEENCSKSPISLVFEIGIKRNLPVDFKVLREEGPAHMRTFVTGCIVGDIMTEGEGSGKKISKKKAAQKMLEELKKLPPQTPVTSPVKRIKVKISSKKNYAEQSKNDLTESKVGIEKPWHKKKISKETETTNPITKLLEWHQNNKEAEPEFKLISEIGKENSRRRQFIMEVSSNQIVARGVGNSKKLAKLDAAQNLLTSITESKRQHANIKENDNSETSNSSEIDSEAICLTNSHNIKLHKQDTAQNFFAIGKESEQRSSIGAESEITKNKPNINELSKNLAEIVPHSSLQEATCNSLLPNKKSSSEQEKDKNEAATTSFSTLEETTNIANISTKSQNLHMKDKLMYLAKLLGFDVEFSDYPKGNHNEFLTIVMLSTTPPQICHGVGVSANESQEDAAKNALKILSEMGLNNAVKA